MQLREKMQNDISDVPIKVKTEKKLSSSSRRLSRQASISSNSSNEIYYGDSSVSIPFRWESQPGTPKVNLHDRKMRPLPPLTPPPSYKCSSPARKSVKIKHFSDHQAANTNSNTSILQTILPTLNLIKKSHVHSSPSSFSSSSSSSSPPWSSSPSVRSSPFTPKSAGGQRRKLSSSSRRKDEDDKVDE